VPNRKNKRHAVAIVIPNWNREEDLAACLRALQAQREPGDSIVVDNGSTDGSVARVQRDFPDVELIVLPKNTGFAGGVNAGIRRALEHGYEFVALMNNDALADTQWLGQLLAGIREQPRIGIATSKIVDFAGKKLDSTGEFYTIWGLPFARGRGEPADDRYDGHRDIFGASGGASIFRTSMLKQIGLFDEDFFAYYEDTDLSFRAQLCGWRVRFVPGAVVRHRIGATSGSIKGFTTYQTLKNLPLLCYKNVPLRFLPAILPRLWLAYTLFFWSAVARGQGGAALKGWLMSILLTPKKLWQRRRIQDARTVPTAYIGELLVRDLPPGADRLRSGVNLLRLRQNRNTK
jgi:GT2 family glycosyltransferase